jgi:hypothetical protein
MLKCVNQNQSCQYIVKAKIHFMTLYTFGCFSSSDSVNVFAPVMVRYKVPNPTTKEIKNQMLYKI